jgi:hypothetical protein
MESLLKISKFQDKYRDICSQKALENEDHEINAEKKNPKQSKALSDERNKLKKFHYMVI